MIKGPKGGRSEAIFILQRRSKLIRLSKTLLSFLVCIPVQAIADIDCPIFEGGILRDFISSEQLVEAMSSIPPERDEFQSSADYTATVWEALGTATEATVFEVDEGDRSFISYNADEQRIEVGTGHFDSYSVLDFDRYQLREFFDLSLDDFEQYMSEHLIVGLADRQTSVGTFTGANSFGLTKDVIVYDRVSVSLHGGLYEGIESLTAWSFAPDEFIDGGYGISSPHITIPMPPDVAREEMPGLRAVVATTGLSEIFFVTNTYFPPTTNWPVEITSVNFLFITEILCGGFIDGNSRIIKVVPLIDEPIRYPSNK